MFRMRFLPVLAVSTTLALAFSPAHAAESPLGVWLDNTGRGAVEIKDCGGKLCGHVVWTKVAGDAKRGCGKQIIGDVRPSGGSLWDGGWVYSPDRGRRYDVELKPLSDGTLRVKGYAGSKLFSRTMIWTKAPADLVRCGSETAADSAVANEPAPAAAAPATLPAAVPAPQPTAAPAAKAEKVAKAAPAPAVPPAQSGSAALMREKADPAPSGTDQPASSGTETEASENAGSEDAGSAIGDLVAKLESLDGGKNGYGLKETGDGNCRLKVPYVNLTFRCKD